MPETDINLSDLTGEELLKAIETAGLKVPFDKFLKSHTDQAVSKAIQTRTENISKEKKSLEDRLAELEGKINKQSKDTLIKAALKKADLNEDFANYVTGETPEEIDGAVSKLKEVLTKAEQSHIDNKLNAGELAPVKKGTAVKEENTLIDEYVKSKQTAPVSSVFKGGRFTLETKQGSDNSGK